MMIESDCGIRCPKISEEAAHQISNVGESLELMASNNPFKFLKGAFQYLKNQKRMGKALEQNQLDKGTDCLGPIPVDASNPDGQLICGLEVRTKFDKLIIK